MDFHQLTINEIIDTIDCGDSWEYDPTGREQIHCALFKAIKELDHRAEAQRVGIKLHNLRVSKGEPELALIKQDCAEKYNSLKFLVMRSSSSYPLYLDVEIHVHPGGA